MVYSRNSYFPTGVLNSNPLMLLVLTLHHICYPSTSGLIYTQLACYMWGWTLGFQMVEG